MKYPDEVIVTGASGFIGGFVCEAFLRSGIRVRRFSRSIRKGDCQEGWIAFDPHGESDYSAFKGAKAIVHLAGRAHVFNDKSNDPRLEYFKTNVEASCRIAEFAIKAGIKRLVFVSSIGVNGNSSGMTPFDETCTPAPKDLYAISKHEAEYALAELCNKSGLELVIIRPPLVYGPGNPGNFLRLLKLTNTGLPLPIGAFNNIKSLVFVENLASALVACTMHPTAAGQIYLVSDGYDISIVELVRQLRALMGRPARMASIPVPLLYGLSRIAGKADVLERFTSTLVVDAGKIRRDLGWIPLVPFHDGLKRTVDWFMGKEA